ncbi:hypothetical protein TWF506_006221 [Arthrobotrys conoides]|uniref:Uncharacterized protein n=1 Tax=Arthrobotrys conoides TaxID=74498 RepID=A0AAN8NT29_9PEZI
MGRLVDEEDEGDEVKEVKRVPTKQLCNGNIFEEEYLQEKKDLWELEPCKIFGNNSPGFNYSRHTDEEGNPGAALWAEESPLSAGIEAPLDGTQRPPRRERLDQGYIVL